MKVARPSADTLAVTCRDLTVLHTQIEYVTVPWGRSLESRCTSEADTQKAPGFGGGVGDFDGVGVFDGDGLGDLDGEELGLLDGVVVFDGDGLVVVDWLGLPVGLGLREGLELPVGLGLCDGLELPVGLVLAVELALVDGPESEIRLALMAAAEADPQRLLLPNGMRGSASTGATAGPDSRNNPAPAATATCPTRTTLTGTAALR